MWTAPASVGRWGADGYGEVMWGLNFRAVCAELDELAVNFDRVFRESERQFGSIAAISRPVGINLSAMLPGTAEVQTVEHRLAAEKARPAGLGGSSRIAAYPSSLTAPGSQCFGPREDPP